MAQLDVSDVLSDPDFTSIYDLYADASTVVDGLNVPMQNVTLGLVGVVQPAGARSLDMLPEGTRRSGAIDVWTTVRLSVGDQNNDADDIVWHGSLYRVMNVTDWTDFGVGWVKATCSLEQVNFTPPSVTRTIPPGTTAPTPVVGAVGGGQIRYSETAGNPPVQVLANQRTLISFTVDPTQTQDYLNAPFEGNVSFDGTTIRPYQVGDFYFILVNLLVTPGVTGGQIFFDIDVGSPTGPTTTDSQQLGPAGGVERVTGKLYSQDLRYFAQNGGKLYVTTTVPVTIVNETVLIAPLSSGGAAQ